jgi:hypothetical protein
MLAGAMLLLTIVVPHQHLVRGNMGERLEGCPMQVASLLL